MNIKNALENYLATECDYFDKVSFVSESEGIYKFEIYENEAGKTFFVALIPYTYEGESSGYSLCNIDNKGNILESICDISIEELEEYDL